MRIKDVIKKLNLSIKKGKIAIIGSTARARTFCRYDYGLLEPSSGEILIDGESL